MATSLDRRLSALEETMTAADPLVVRIICFDALPLSGFEVQGVRVVDRLPGETENDLYNRCVQAAWPAALVVVRELRQAVRNQPIVRHEHDTDH